MKEAVFGSWKETYQFCYQLVSLISSLGIPIIFPHSNKPLVGATGVVVDIVLVVAVVEASAKEG